jgi:hypothetical protein
MPHISDIQMRDPFVVREGKTYYLFGSTDTDIWRTKAVGFDMYKSEGNLTDFEGPFPAFRPPENFWAEVNFWAPEVHQYRDEYFMFATFKPKTGRRGTAVLKSTAHAVHGAAAHGAGVAGPYIPWSEGPITPAEWECLDGTLYIDRDKKHWMVFCHEWVQVGDGEICLIPLTDDLKKAAGKPELLFRASEAPWAYPLKGREPPAYVTDGPSLYTTTNGSAKLRNTSTLLT